LPSQVDSRKCKSDQQQQQAKLHSYLDRSIEFETEQCTPYGKFVAGSTKVVSRHAMPNTILFA
jgi:hypothetical protein